jgi:hypothetical protein
MVGRPSHSLDSNRVDVISGTLKLGLQGANEAGGQHGDPAFVTFGIAHSDLVLSKVEIFDPQAESFIESQATAIKQLNNQLMYAGEMLNDITHFRWRQDGGQILGRLGPDGVN